VRSGDHVEAEQPIATLETTKSAFDLNAPRGGYVYYRLTAHEMVDVGAAVAWLSEQPGAPPPSAANDVVSVDVAPSAGSTSDSTEASDTPRATRKALQVMQEHGLTLADFVGMTTIRVQDVEELARARNAAAVAATSARSPPTVSPSIPQGTEPIEQTASKLIEIAAVTESYRGAVPSTVTISIDHGRVAAHLDRLSNENGVLSVLELALQALGRVLPHFPELNGYHTGSAALHYTSINVGFAVNAGRSLKVPVIRAADRLTLREVARTVRDLVLRYMREELSAADMSSGTFTVTDLSTSDVVQFIPVLNLRQSATLGLCAPRVDGSSDLVLTFDHRMSDGMQAAEFLRELRTHLEGDDPPPDA
jgi:pyruvate/2-oxoglutarate dehydrogenase complex dihydrolipoamide acyltransferase (E2) component